ncbi:MAG: Tim44 domain-containing protein, partial [Hyphomicrobiaceae bacterium]
YEMIVTAFARGDRKELKPLLSREVFDDFSTAISQRETKSEINETTFVGINSSDVIEADLRSGTAHVTVRFVSELISAIKNRAGEVVDGDPKKIREVIDVWTFARELASRNPNWRVVSTSGAA